MNLNRIEAMHETDNPASGKVMQKAGMHYEGRLRQRVYNKGRFADVDLYAVIRQDFITSKRY
jgi:ribosomal-protein-alanine N-acetyltransferase